MFLSGSPRVPLFVCALALLTIAATAPFRAAAPHQTRPLWVARTTLASPESIRQMVAAAQAGGFNTLLVQVRGRGDAYYASTIEPRGPELARQPSFGPPATAIPHAH